jgi:mRNA-degrading endonuclease RelE of RelBE toxin-antitoxin system
MVDIHKYPIKMKKHAALRLIERFDMSIDELHHLFRTARYVKKPMKEGDIGIIERKIGKTFIRIIFKVRNETIWIITVEGGV